jgi:hypothetical protein
VFQLLSILLRAAAATGSLIACDFDLLEKPVAVVAQYFGFQYEETTADVAPYPFDYLFHLFARARFNDAHLAALGFSTARGFFSETKAGRCRQTAAIA